MNHLGILLKFARFGVEMERLRFLTDFEVLLMLWSMNHAVRIEPLRTAFIALVNYFEDGSLLH